MTQRIRGTDHYLDNQASKVADTFDQAVSKGTGKAFKSEINEIIPVGPSSKNTPPQAETPAYTTADNKQ